LQIDYDEDKNAINIHKHGISFTTASHAFNDPNAVIEFDELHSIHEDRYNLIGCLDGHILFIVYTMRGEVPSMISARPATKKEIERYYKQMKQQRR